jgi:hypothetical protein
MIDSNQEFHFYRGEVLLGRVFIVGSDQPYFCGRIEKTEAFAEVAHLFNLLAENRRASCSPAVYGIEPEKREARDRLRKEYEALNREIVGPGLRMVDATTGQLAYEPLDLEVDECGFWWRGHIWQDGKQII